MHGRYSGFIFSLNGFPLCYSCHYTCRPYVYEIYGACVCALYSLAIFFSSHPYRVLDFSTSIVCTFGKIFHIILTFFNNSAIFGRVFGKWSFKTKCHGNMCKYFLAPLQKWEWLKWSMAQEYTELKYTPVEWIEILLLSESQQLSVVN